ncbi:hypothetical protein GCM10020367_46790 [Streptomyces sannanensis]|uniref:Uncharacterized protein n=1 Tax=Streptomyces sannanensis TaxID=285536 RepID=A0ABP6SGS1_9ACTN
MSSLNDSARPASEGSAFTGVQPTLARSRFTSETTVAAADSSALGGCGVSAVFLGACGAGAAVRGGAGFLEAAGGAAGSGRFDGVAEGLASEGEAEGEGGAAAFVPGFLPPADGAVVALVPWSADSPVEPPCDSRFGALSARISPESLLWLPLLRVKLLPPPGRNPEAMATAPTATAAEAPSSPVRTGTDRFFRGVAERRWRPICCAFLIFVANVPHPNE